MTNDTRTDSRVEILECANVKHKEQMDVAACTIFRRGLAREDIHKEPFSFKIQTFLAIGNQSQPREERKGGHDVQSVCGILNAILQYKKTSPQLTLSGQTQNISSDQAQELSTILEKAQKVNDGDFSLPDSHSYVGDNHLTSLSAMKTQGILNLDISGIEACKAVRNKARLKYIVHRLFKLL